MSRFKEGKTAQKIYPQILFLYQVQIKTISFTKNKRQHLDDRIIKAILTTCLNYEIVPVSTCMYQ